MKNILVTGGLGYIGSHTVVKLQEAGFEVTIVDDCSNAKEDVLYHICSITGKMPSFKNLDLKDRNELFAFLEKQSFDGVVHFAAYKAVGESVEKPLSYYKNNLLGLLNLLEAFEFFNLNNIIFSSSCTVYGQADQMPIDEKTPLKQPESPYGKTKAFGEEILNDFVTVSNKKGIALRYFNPVGAHHSSSIGETPNGIPNNLMPYITQTVAGLRKELSVFGKDYETRDGTAIRDYIDVNDLAEAHVLALQYLLDHKNQEAFEVFNLGSGNGSTVLEIIEAFEKANHLKINYKIADRRPGDIQEAYADYSKAKRILGWEPKTPLEVSMKTAWEFQKKIMTLIN